MNDKLVAKNNITWFNGYLKRSVFSDPLLVPGLTRCYYVFKFFPPIGGLVFTLSSHRGVGPYGPEAGKDEREQQ